MKIVPSRTWRISEFVICTALPFLIPLIFEISDAQMDYSLKWKFAIPIGIVYLVWAWLIFHRKDKEETEKFNSLSTRYAFSNAIEMVEEKRNSLVSFSYDNPNFYLPETSVPYEVHDYIAKICTEFKRTIAHVTGVPNEYMSVSFVYRYSFEGATDEEKQWKWITGREMTNNSQLSKFVNKPDTVFHHLIEGSENVLYENEKASLVKDEKDTSKNNYYYSSRDKMHNRIGSIFSVRIMFTNNTKQFVDSILTISSYGRYFTDDADDRNLKNLILEELLPYYQRSIETELGYLYFRHKKKSLATGTPTK